MNHDFESLVERIAAGCEHEVVYNAGDLVSLGLALKADPGLAAALIGFAETACDTDDE